MPGKRQDVLYQAQAILSRRDHATAEVKTKLKRKGFPEEEIAKALHFLQEKNLLDDARFAAAYVASILRAKPVGPRYLWAKLRQRGIGDSIISQVLRGLDDREAELAQQAAEQWRRLHPKHATDKNRLYHFLLSRGFTQAAIQTATSPATS